MNLDYCNREYIMPYEFKVKRLNRTHSSMIMNGTFVKTMDNLMGEGQLYQLVSNRYKEQFPRIKLDLCAILGSLKITNSSPFVAKIASKFMLPLVAKFREKGQKFPERCPIRTDNYHLNYRHDDDFLPAFFLPEGTWKIVANMTMPKLMIARVNFVFDIVTYSSEKQKNKLG
ncbi:uncharacterized protein LOC113378493 [Ctenocephalides felis]|uniref:uncharacterized protein LOC113378493 n=1 Tax=Ctenocephalides felis TaxID=7515 RepID=UPI000E6E334A|nr:uncharacterized protein LOC113378493 [Ctenocephalides felis]